MCYDDMLHIYICYKHSNHDNLECVLRPSKALIKIVFSHSKKLSHDAKPIRV